MRYRKLLSNTRCHGPIVVDNSTSPFIFDRSPYLCLRTGKHPHRHWKVGNIWKQPITKYLGICVKAIGYRTLSSKFVSVVMQFVVHECGDISEVVADSLSLQAKYNRNKKSIRCTGHYTFNTVMETRWPNDKLHEETSVSHWYFGFIWPSDSRHCAVIYFIHILCSPSNCATFWP